jgi:cytochrome P450/NADPH-cytochrome P450 reductase
LLERYPECDVPFEVYLDMLPPLQPRYYSISSSPMVSPRTCSITVGVLRSAAADSGREYAGVCSNYLSAMPDNATIFVFKRELTIPFRPPADPTVPMIMVGAGTGLAPFRGFLQEWAAQGERGDELAPSLLFFGCRTPGHDDLYRAEMDGFKETANVRTYTAYSRAPVDGRKHAQHEMLAHQDEIGDLIDSGAIIFVCGNARTLAPGVRAALIQINASRTGSTADEAEGWLAQLRAENRLTVRADRPMREAASELVATERPRGVFSRQLILGDNLDLDKINAGYHDGVLQLTIPVTERAKPRKISIAIDSDHQTIEGKAQR